MKTKPKKSLGQNFLRDPKILKKIADFAHIEKNDTVVEVGPGEGGLTKILLGKAKRVIAVEKDERLVDNLRIKFADEISSGKLEIICEDILNYESRIMNYALVGNIPYYITGAILKKFLESENLPFDSAQGKPKTICFVIQKEVAERIIARDGKESILSISIKVFGTPEYGGTIKAGSFYPKPKVDSGIIAVRNVSKKRFKEIIPPTPLYFKGGQNTKTTEQKFFEILKKGFTHKRKLLIKNLGVSEEVFRKCGIPEKARAEDLKVEDWICLTKELM